MQLAWNLQEELLLSNKKEFIGFELPIARQYCVNKELASVGDQDYLCMDVWRNIASSLDRKSLLSMKSTCKQFHHDAKFADFALELLLADYLFHWLNIFQFNDSGLDWHRKPLLNGEGIMVTNIYNKDATFLNMKTLSYFSNLLEFKSCPSAQILIMVRKLVGDIKQACERNPDVCSYEDIRDVFFFDERLSILY